MKNIKNIVNGIKHGYRSGLEKNIAEQLEKNNIEINFETIKINYTIPEKIHKYTPDFILPNGIIIETKGRFIALDRKKHLLIKQQYPNLDIRFVFSNPNARLYKRAKTRYWQWCEKYGFLWAKKEIPQEWIKEAKKKK